MSAPVLEMDRVLVRRLRARRWSFAGGRQPFSATAHAGFELGWLDEGAMRYRTGGVLLDVRPGAAVLIPVGVDHATEFVGPLRGGSVHLDEALVLAVAEAAGVSLPQRPLLLDDGAALVTLGKLVAAELLRDTPDARLCADALAEALAARVVGAAAPAPPSRSVDPRVRAAVDCIRARFAEPLDVEEIATATGMSRFHLSRLFKEHTGKSPYQYLLDVRLDEAARLLRRGRPVTDAALSVGFSDLSRFARMFHHRFGLLPRDYSATTACRSASSMTSSALTS